MTTVVIRVKCRRENKKRTRGVYKRLWTPPVSAHPVFLVSCFFLDLFPEIKFKMRGPNTGALEFFEIGEMLWVAVLLCRGAERQTLPSKMPSEGAENEKQRCLNEQIRIVIIIRIVILVLAATTIPITSMVFSAIVIIGAFATVRWCLRDMMHHPCLFLPSLGVSIPLRSINHHISVSICFDILQVGAFEKTASLDISEQPGPSPGAHSAKMEMT